VTSDADSLLRQESAV